MRSIALSLASFLAFSITALALPEPSATAQEWTRFRGPNGTGESEATTVPAVWTDSDYNWSVKLPGVGHSSPVLWGDKIFLMSADPESATRFVLCLSAADGKLLWKRDYPGQPHHLHVRSSYASCTPAVDAENVYVAWSDPEHTLLRALDHTGNEKWNLDLGPWVSQHGFGTSPIVYDDLVIVTSSQEPSKRADMAAPKESFVVAVEKETGKIRWRTERGIDTTSYSVPCVRKNDKGVDELVMLSTAEGFFALDPKTGRENWSMKAFTMRTVSSPLLVDGLIFGTTGSGGGGNYVVAMRPGPTPEIAYEIKKEAPYVPTPVANGELLFLWSDKGIVTCINAGTGKQVWQKRVGGVGYSGSPVRVADKVYCVDEAGTVVVISAGPEFKELGRVDLNEECRSTPAVADGRMYLRTISHLHSLGGKK
jgi:outer membrane protein assembly factor BamB